MKTMHNKEKKQQGFTLIEFMVVIALIGLGLALVVTQFGQANTANKVTTGVKNLTSLSGAISSFKSTRDGYTGITAAVLRGTNAVPDNMTAVAAKITSVFNGDVLVAAGVDTNTFTVTYPLVPIADCVEIASRVVGAFDPINVTGSATVITGVVSAQTACEGGTAVNGKVSLVFTGT